MHYTDQSAFDARFEWGEAGLRALGPDASAIVIVDVLSFSTAVDVAVSAGATVVPYRWRDDSAEELARTRGAYLAGSRTRISSEHPYSLSPGSLRGIPAGSTIVLPSPNGATLSAIATEFDCAVFAGCLRNAEVIGAACRSVEGPIAVIAAGERWGDHGSDSLRPAYEDLIGAGAILSALGASRPSPEAKAAISAFDEARESLLSNLKGCSSGRELIEKGYEPDVECSAMLNVSSAAPRLVNGAYTFTPE